MHGNQWVLKIAVLKYYSVSKRGTTAKSNPKQATDPISLHTKFGDNSSNTFPLNERKPCVTPDIGRRTPDAGHRTSDIGHRTAKKAKIIYPPPRGVDIMKATTSLFKTSKDHDRTDHCFISSHLHSLWLLTHACPLALSHCNNTSVLRTLQSAGTKIKCYSSLIRLGLHIIIFHSVDGKYSYILNVWQGADEERIRSTQI